jgi:CelD/BcsL family acetyltransferase involved in cellulose biosynthesis
MMEVTRCRTADELAALAETWDPLAGGVPMRSFAWQAGWWRHYGHCAPRQELFVLAVRDSRARTVGIAPWFVQRGRFGRRKICFLGAGDVCSDYLSLLTAPGHELEVARRLAEHLVGDGRGEWDLLELEGVDAEDAPVAALLKELARLGCQVRRRRGPNCWRLALPATWDEYVGGLSKSHRKQVRRCESRVLDMPRASLQFATSVSQLEGGWAILVDLHQRRRHSLGQPGCFASDRFAAFHYETARAMLEQGRLRLAWLVVDGKPMAAEYHLTGDGLDYAYQAGVDPERLDDEPGRLITIALIRKAIEDGLTAMDFLRGDEPYKAHFRAEPRPSVVCRVVPPGALHRVREAVAATAETTKYKVKSALAMVSPARYSPDASH